MVNKYYVGGTYTFELALTLTTFTGVVIPAANQVFFNLIKPNGAVVAFSVAYASNVFYYTTLTGDLTPAGDWAYYWSINTGTIIVPATDPVPFQVRKVPGT